MSVDAKTETLIGLTHAHWDIVLGTGNITVNKAFPSRNLHIKKKLQSVKMQKDDGTGESIMLSEISQAVRDRYHMIPPLTGT